MARAGGLHLRQCCCLRAARGCQRGTGVIARSVDAGAMRAGCLALEQARALGEPARKIKAARLMCGSGKGSSACGGNSSGGGSGPPGGKSTQPHVEVLHCRPQGTMRLCRCCELRPDAGSAPHENFGIKPRRAQKRQEFAGDRFYAHTKIKAARRLAGLDQLDHVLFFRQRGDLAGKQAEGGAKRVVLALRVIRLRPQMPHLP